jgi:hypothetical protein
MSVPKYDHLTVDEQRRLDILVRHTGSRNPYLRNLAGQKLREFLEDLERFDDYIERKLDDAKEERQSIRVLGQ